MFVRVDEHHEGDHVDKERAKAFMDTMVGILNGGSLAMMCSIGHRTGLFDTMASMDAVSSAQLAEASELNERYVREWLWAMASGGIVDYDASTETFVLPEEHQMLVTRAGGPLNLANNMQNIALLGEVEDDVVDAFRTGAGVPYSRFPGFQRLMAEESAARFDAGLLDSTIPNIPGAVELLTSGGRLADVGCGSGHAIRLLAEAYPNSTFIGFDFSDAGLATARADASAAGLTNVEFVAVDAAALERVAEFDIITTFDAIHDQAKPAEVLSNIERALKPGGKYLCVEPKAASALADNMAEPIAPFQYTVSTMHCMSVAIAGGGEGLGTAWGTERTIEYLERAGFVDIEVVTSASDRTNSHFVCRKS